MQSVWSRIAQTRCICNCPACVTNTGALTARRTTAAVARSRIRTGDVFTVFASSLAATATILDSSKKDARREQWEQVIGEARAAVQATEVEQQNRLAQLSHLTREDAYGLKEESEPKSAYGHLRENCLSLDKTLEESDREADTWVKVFQWAAQNRETRALCGFQDWRGPSLTLLRQLSSEQIQQLLSNRSVLRAFYGGSDREDLIDETVEYSLSAKKLRTLEWSTAKLVLNLLSHTKSLPDGQDADERVTRGSDHDTNQTQSYNHQEKGSDELATAHVGCALSSSNVSPNSMPDVAVSRQLLTARTLTDRLKYIEKRLDMLEEGPLDARSQTYEEFMQPIAPRYHKNPPNSSKQLNFSLSYLLRKLSREGDQSPIMSKICQNLLAAKTPPNIHTFNMLLVRFCQLEDRDMIHAVLESLRECHMRPNELTHSLLLRYYTASNNVLGFTKYLLLMNGYSGGLSLAAPDQKIPSFALDRYRFVGGPRLKTVVKARLNSEVYEALIIGTLRFYGARSAMKYFRDMINEGWQASTAMLASILESCCEQLQWEDGLCVWRQLIASTTTDSLLGHAFESVLLLCKMCKQDLAFDHILQDGIDRGVPLTPRAASLVNDKGSERYPTTFVSRNPKAQVSQSTAVLGESEVAAEDQLQIRHDRSNFESEGQGYQPAINQPSEKVNASSTDGDLNRKEIMHPLQDTSSGLEPSMNIVVPRITEPRNNPDSEMISELSAQVRGLNQNLQPKMTVNEYRTFKSKVANRKNPEVIANSNYADYKHEVNTKFEDQSREGRAIYQKPMRDLSDDEYQLMQSRFLHHPRKETLVRAVYEGWRRGNHDGMTIDQYLSKLFNEQQPSPRPTLSSSWDRVPANGAGDSKYPDAWDNTAESASMEAGAS